MEKISLRAASPADAEMVFEWRNAPETRRYFFNPQALEKAEHLRWFEQSLHMPTRALLIALKGEEAIGVLRYDREGSTAEIDIYLRPGLAGQGLGSQILSAGTEWVKKHFPETKTLLAKVVSANLASARAFEKAGFALSQQVFEKNLGAE